MARQAATTLNKTANPWRHGCRQCQWVSAIAKAST